MLESEGQTAEQQAPLRPPPNASRVTAVPIQLRRLNVPQVLDQLALDTKTKFKTFINNFVLNDNVIYIEQIRLFRHSNKTTLYVDYTHLFEFDNDMASIIQLQFYRVESYLRLAVQEIVAEIDPEYISLTNNYAGEDALMKEFWVSIYGLDYVTSLRKIKSDLIGKLTSIRGTITRTSEVRPELLFGTFKCGECNQTIPDIEQQFKYTQPIACPDTLCNNRKTFHLQTSLSKFTDWQKCRLQESPSEVPSGAMPRSMDVFLRHELVDRAKAGDKVIIHGTPIVVPDVGQMIGLNAEIRREVYGRGRDGFGNDGVSGFKGMGHRELTYKISFMSGFVEMEGKGVEMEGLGEEIDGERVLSGFNDNERENFEKLRADKLLAHKLVHSVAPHIFGHEDIKKGLLLQMLGGVHKQTKDGINLRGDINVCIVGDPSTAKSQFLKYVSSFMPRAIYTSGKASSAAGLTASVMKDEETGEFTIEAGALMLADNGICCIDEFDKMNLVDQVAIHEAMEQQTISIAKAGIQATLNARASILAAANPVRGRYDKKLTLRQNINMSPPIMSRFDLFFVVLDECDENTDFNIATHIVNFHRHIANLNEDGSPGDEGDFLYEESIEDISQLDLGNYLRYARTLRPKLSNPAREFLVKKYRQFRQEDSTGVDKSSYRITVRQLESMLRLSEAIAKLHLKEIIEESHVREAAKLLRTSIVTIDQDRVEFEEDQQQPQQTEQQMEVDQQEEVIPSSLQETEQTNQQTTTQQSQQSQPPTPTTQPKLRMEASEYARMSKILIQKILSMESQRDSRGVKTSEVVDWYLEQKEDEMEDVEELMNERRLCLIVLKRMVRKDNSLMEIEEFEELLGADGVRVTEVEDPVLTLHPNYYGE